MIKLTNVKKTYGDVTAVNNLSLEIEKGQILGLLGPNGAGKSTTMKIISGFLVPDNGEVSVNETDMREDPLKCKMKIGYMPENNPLYKDMLVREALDYALQIREVKNEEKKKRIDYVVKATGLENVYNKPISELSKGYKQRVGIAQVLAGDPEILILDEPTEGLDPNQRASIRNLIKDLGKDRTVIISTHVMQEVEAMCNRIVLINKGSIVADGDINSVLKSGTKENNVTIVIKSKSGDPLSEIKKANSVLNVTNSKNSDGSFKFKVTCKDSNTFFESFTSLLKKNDWILMELKQEQTNLEDIFKQLTNV